MPAPVLRTLLSEAEEERMQLVRAYETYVNRIKGEKKISDAEADEYKSRANNKEKTLLTFPSKQEGDTFLREQAAAGRRFIALSTVGPEGGYTGEYDFSDGDGTLYQGRFDPKAIEELEELAKLFQSSPEIMENSEVKTHSKEMQQAFKTQDETKFKEAIAKIKTIAEEAAPSRGMRP